MSHPHDPYRPPESGGTGAARQNFGENGRGDGRPYDGPQGHAGQAGGDSPARQHFGEQGDGRGPARPVQAAPIVWQRTGSRAQSRAWSGPHPFDAPQARDVFVPPRPVTESDIARPAHDRVAPPLQKEQPTPAPEDAPAPVAFPEPVPPPARAAEPQRAEPRSPEQRSPEPTADSDEDDALTIGRGRGNSIVLDDMLVSRHHVRITADDDGLVLQDLGSRNGTYVNGHRVERAALHEGDRLGIGATTFEVRDGWLVSV